MRQTTYKRAIGKPMDRKSYSSKQDKQMSYSIFSTGTVPVLRYHFLLSWYGTKYWCFEAS